MYIDCNKFCKIDENLTITNKALHVSLIAKKKCYVVKMCSCVGTADV